MKGKYGYIDPTGELREVEYGASPDRGFEPRADGLVVAPPTLVDEVVLTRLFDYHCLKSRNQSSPDRSTPRARTTSMSPWPPPLPPSSPPPPPGGPRAAEDSSPTSLPASREDAAPFTVLSAIIEVCKDPIYHVQG